MYQHLVAATLWRIKLIKRVKNFSQWKARNAGKIRNISFTSVSKLAFNKCLVNEECHSSNNYFISEVSVFNKNSCLSDKIHKRQRFDFGHT
jgi:hypothetical protein